MSEKVYNKQIINKSDLAWRTVSRLVDEAIPLDHPKRFASRVIRWYDLIHSTWYSTPDQVTITCIIMCMYSTFIRIYLPYRAAVIFEKCHVITIFVLIEKLQCISEEELTLLRIKLQLNILNRTSYTKIKLNLYYYIYCFIHCIAVLSNSKHLFMTIKVELHQPIMLF